LQREKKAVQCSTTVECGEKEGGEHKLFNQIFHETAITCTLIMITALVQQFTVAARVAIFAHEL